MTASNQASWAPFLTGYQLAGVLGGSFGFNRNTGGPDIPTVAAALGVSRSTVYRWLNKRSLSSAKIPPDRLRQLLTAGRPRPRTLRQQAQELEYAHTALNDIAEYGESAVLSEWHDRSWLQPHYVAVIAHPYIGLRGLATPRAEDDLLDRASAGGIVRANIVVPNRFKARLVLAEVLKQVDQWRFVPGSMPVGELRRTWMWLDGIDANLHAAAKSVDVPVLPIDSLKSD